MNKILRESRHSLSVVVTSGPLLIDKLFQDRLLSRSSLIVILAQEFLVQKRRVVFNQAVVIPLFHHREEELS